MELALSSSEPRRPSLQAVESHRETNEQAVFRFLDRLHKTACIGVRVEKLLEEQTMAYLEGKTISIHGRFFEGFKPLERELAELPDETRRETFKKAIYEYGLRLHRAFLALQYYKKEDPQITEKENSRLLGEKLFKNILKTKQQPLGVVRGEIRTGYLRLICSDDADFDKLRRGRVEPEKEKGLLTNRMIAAFHMPSASLDTYDFISIDVPLVVLHEKRCGTSLPEIERHELQHVIHHQALQLFAGTELERKEKRPLSKEEQAFSEQLRAIKDEVLAFTREGRSPQAIKDALALDAHQRMRDPENPYQHLFDAIAPAKRDWVRSLTNDVIEEIGKSTLAFKFGPSGLKVLVNLLYGIPLDRIPRWMTVINKFYSERWARERELFLVHEAHALVNDTTLPQTLGSPNTYIPLRHRHLLEKYRQARTSFDDAIFVLKPVLKDLPNPLPTFEAIPSGLLDLDHATHMQALPAPLLGKEMKYEFRRLLSDATRPKQELEEIALEWSRLETRRIESFEQDLKTSSLFLPKQMQRDVANGLVALPLRPLVKKLKQLIDRTALHEEAIEVLRQNFIKKEAFKRAICADTSFDGTHPYKELDRHSEKLRKIQEEIRDVWNQILRDHTPPVHLVSVPTPIPVSLSPEKKKRGPDPLDAIRESVLRTAITFSRDTQAFERLRFSLPNSASSSSLFAPKRGTIQEDFSIMLSQLVKGGSGHIPDKTLDVSSIHQEEERVVCLIQLRDKKTNQLIEQWNVVLPLAPEMWIDD